MSTPKGFKGLSIDASSPPVGSDFGAVSQPASSLPPAHHTGGVTGGVLVIKVRWTRCHS